MAAQYKFEQDGRIIITLDIKPEGSFLEQEEQIAAAVAEVGRLATELSLKRFDTQGQPVILDNVKHTSRGEEKKFFKRRGGKSK